MTKVLLADDHPIVLKGLREAIAEVMDIEVIGEARTGREALRQVRAEAPDVVVLDLTMPEMSGTEALQRLHDEAPALPVLILSMHPEDQYAARMLRAGAAGYLMKSEAPKKVVEAIRKVVQGRKFVSSEVAQQLAARLEADVERPPHERLSEREFQVMLQIAQGRATQRIAEELSLSPSTVRTYRARVFEKMRFGSEAALVRYTIEERLLE